MNDPLNTQQKIRVVAAYEAMRVCAGQDWSIEDVLTVADYINTGEINRWVPSVEYTVSKDDHM